MVLFGRMNELMNEKLSELIIEYEFNHLKV